MRRPETLAGPLQQYSTHAQSLLPHWTPSYAPMRPLSRTRCGVASRCVPWLCLVPASARPGALDHRLDRPWVDPTRLAYLPRRLILIRGQIDARPATTRSVEAYGKVERVFVDRKLAAAEAAFAFFVGGDDLTAKLQSHPHHPEAQISFYPEMQLVAGATASHTASGYTVLPPHGPVDARPPRYEFPTSPLSTPRQKPGSAIRLSRLDSQPDPGTQEDREILFEWQPTRPRPPHQW
jgi:hypothetical protein